MTPDDFTLSAVPLRGPLAPFAAMLGDGDGVLLDIGEDTGWWGRVRARPDKAQRDGAVWIESWCWCHTPITRLDSVDLVTSPAARSAVVAWLAAQGHTDAGASDAALLSALRAVCGLPPAPPSVDRDTDDIPF